MRRRVGWGLVLALVLASCSDGAGPDAAGSSIEVVEVEGTPIYRWAPQVDAWFQLVGSGDALVAVAEHLPSGIVRSTDRGRTWQAAKVPGRLGTRDGVALASNGDAGRGHGLPRRGLLLLGLRRPRGDLHRDRRGRGSGPRTVGSHRRGRRHPGAHRRAWAVDAGGRATRVAIRGSWQELGGPRTRGGARGCRVEQSRGGAG